MEEALGQDVPLLARAYQVTQTFSQTFPAPYRVILLLSLGVFCWSLNVHGLRVWGLKPDEVPSTEPFSSAHPLPLHSRKRRDDQERDERPYPADFAQSEEESNAAESSLAHTRARTSHKGPLACSSPPVDWASQAPIDLYALAFLLAMWALINWFAFQKYVANDGDSSWRGAQAMQGIAILGLVLAAVWPGNVLFKNRRKQFGRALLSLCLPQLLLLRPPTFPAILLADVLTSFAKVLGDVWLTGCFLIPWTEDHTWWNGRGSWAVPLLVSLPYAIRLLQCLAEYRGSANVENIGLRAPTTVRIQVRSKRPLANALKYASVFPVIWISASQSTRAGAVPDGESSNGLWQLWLLSVLVNSLFSFWWDVANDWGLQIFRAATWTSASSELSSQRKSLHRRGLSVWPAPRFDGQSLHADGSSKPNSHAFHSRSLSTKFLRPPSTGGMLFSPTIYQLAVLSDLVLRFTWSLKLSPHLSQLVELESGVFVLETLEILRRCGWVFLRIEWETVKRRRADELLRGDSAGRGELDDEIEEIRLEMDRLG